MANLKKPDDNTVTDAKEPDFDVDGGNEGDNIKLTPFPEVKNVVVPVEWGDLSNDTFLWYIQNMHREENYVHICHVPDFRSHISSKMTPVEVLEVMIEFNGVADQLQIKYETLLQDHKVCGKFVRVGGNTRWTAITDYCKLVDAMLLVIGTEPKPNRLVMRHTACSKLDQISPTAKEGNTKPEDVADTQKRGSVQSSRLGWEFMNLLQDSGPCVATVTHDVLHHCHVPTVVYRRARKSQHRDSIRSSVTSDLEPSTVKAST